MMKTFVLDMPKELLQHDYRDGKGDVCAMGALYASVFGEEWALFHSNTVHIDECINGLEVMGIPVIWQAETAYQNTALTTSTSRVKNLKRRLRALESYGHVEFLFLDELPQGEGVDEKQNLHELVLS